MHRIAIVLASTRPNRAGEAVARWVLEHAGQRDDATFDLLDLAEEDLPPLDEPLPPASGHYVHPHTQRWSATIARYDGYVFVTPEYNHSYPGTLKNALDRLSGEWRNKVVGFVSYGYAGGVRAVEALRPVVGALQMADVAATVSLSMIDDFTDHSTFTPGRHQGQALTTLLDQLLAWETALGGLRQPTTTADPDDTDQPQLATTPR